MPRYHVVASAQRQGTETIVRSTMRPNVMEQYRWMRPFYAFDFPMDSMTRDPGLISMSYDELETMLETAGEPYWIGRVYRNYDSDSGRSNDLDFYVRWFRDELFHHYLLHMPTIVQEAEASIGHTENVHADDPYPAPSQWYMAVSRSYVRSYTMAEYNAIGTNEGVPSVAIGTPAAATGTILTDSDDPMQNRAD